MNKQTKFGKWTVEKAGKLGSGGNGTVSKVKDNGGVLGAIKLLNKRSLKNKTRILRFQHEIVVMKKNEDLEGILPIWDAYLPEVPSKKNPPWFVMPIASTLEEICKKKLSMEDCVSLCCELAQTLAKLHERGVSHRDIKPSNIFKYEGRWCVGDFGLADSPDKEPLSVDEEKLGPLYYIAPEMLHGIEGSDGRQADVYSLAKLLWKLVSGENFPLQGEYNLNSDYTLYTYTDDKRAHLLDGLIQKCSTLDRNSRPEMDQMHSELHSWLNPRMVDVVKNSDLKTFSQAVKFLEAGYRRQSDSNQSIQQDRESETTRFLQNFSTILNRLKFNFEEAEIGVARYYEPAGGNAKFFRATRKDLKHMGSSDGTYFFETSLQVRIRTESLNGEINIGANVGVPAYDKDRKRVPYDSALAWGAGGILLEVSPLSGEKTFESFWGHANQFMLNSPSEKELITTICNGLNTHFENATKRWIKIMEEITNES